MELGRIQLSMCELYKKIKVIKSGINCLESRIDVIANILFEFKANLHVSRDCTRRFVVHKLYGIQ